MEYNSFALEGIKSDAEMKLQLEIILRSHMCLNFCLGKKTNEYGKIKGHVNQL